MVKTITIADDVYEELVKLKNNKSFSEVIRELISYYKKKNSNVWVLELLLKINNKEFADRLEKVVKEIRDEFNKAWK